MKTTIDFSEKAKESILLYEKHVKSGFTPLAVPIVKESNATLWDIDGNEYIDFSCFFSVANMGHAHPKIVHAAVQALQQGPMVNTAVMSPGYAKLAAKIEEVLGYSYTVCLLSGADATDTATKIARKWGYEKKGIAENQAFVLTSSACYHGITISTHSMSSTRDSKFGPYVPLVGPTSPSGVFVEYGDIKSLEEALKKDHATIAAFMVEPIQGSAGVVDPPKDYICQAYELCQKYNVLFIADEVQTALGRAGYPLKSVACGAKPDLVCLGKALGGGVAPISAVIGTSKVMDNLIVGDIGSTMAALPSSTAAAIAALDVLVEDDICAKSLSKGKLLRELILKENIPGLKYVSGDGMFAALVFDLGKITDQFNCRRLSALCACNGLMIGSASGGKRARICPPPTISLDDLKKGVKILGECCRSLSSIEGAILNVN